ncbi:MAG: hypothetical protein RLZZ292_1864 [Bacteroidota bacterium]|jgi:hypothetical protein
MKKLSSIQFHSSTKLSATQQISLKGGDDKRGDRPGGGVQGLAVYINPTTIAAITSVVTAAVTAYNANNNGN